MSDAQSPFGEAADAKYVLLTTFRKDGTPKPTPIWAAMDGGRMVVWTETESWKVKRIRRDNRVEVQACDARGKKRRGAAVTGTAEILDAAGTERARELIGRKYGLLGKALVTASSWRRGKSGTVGIAITPSMT
ncbi:PPOX class F420-dependent oxidoreductase [Gordonia sp. HNM0687]|uniref:PPOX class F420-dependent oxidoreductase n=1 Tax=Gordonia mangrovi TaxID=2665643 RepID=A0A6L7GKR3_9ACTN|nr:PPOX class F420-dependent oxidoreductase [Gordonia mangrovi]MXP19811.1 PPOX class F420-dependent oxidoreductase [Gordonia mangrovi]UVF79562.1 PPOX class F420-dependent oxidoreductase [Gordonia mangrovi]